MGGPPAGAVRPRRGPPRRHERAHLPGRVRALVRRVQAAGASPASGRPDDGHVGRGRDGHGCTLYDYEAGVFALHDVATGKTFRAEAEGLKGRCWVGGKDDWLVTADDTCGVELLNPVSGARVSLPSFDTIPGVEVGRRRRRVQSPRGTRRVLAIASAGRAVPDAGAPGRLPGRRYVPSESACVHEIWRGVLDGAEEPGGPRGRGRRAGYADTIVHEGKVIAVSRNRAVYSWEMSDGKTTGPVVVRRPDSSYPFEYKFHLAVSSDGGILLISMLGHIVSLGSRNRQVRRMIFDDQRNFHACDIALHELDSSDGTWRCVSDIGGDRALFLGANYPFYVGVPRGSQKLKANCIYVADMFDADAAVVDLEVTSDRRFSRLIYPGENDMYQMPIWFRPTAYLDDG
ncbi:hypothetical protein EJB05_39942, partial [Eragrostis curvula]